MTDQLRELMSVVPGPDAWTIDWQQVCHYWPMIEALSDIRQNPYFHQEGDVFEHTKMVCSELVQTSRWRQMAERQREILFFAALFHDLGKQSTTKVNYKGTLSSRGHSIRGARIVRRLLWISGFPFKMREQIVHLVATHQLPYLTIERELFEKTARKISTIIKPFHLITLTEADARGRIAENQNQIIENVLFCKELFRSMDCLTKPAKFASPHTRFLYFNNLWDQPFVAAEERFSTEAVILSGLPGAGKDHWINHHLSHWPVISVEQIRKEYGVSDSENQRDVLHEAKERALRYIKEKTPFIWNDTNIRKKHRQLIIRFLADNNVWSRLVYVEPPAHRYFEQSTKTDSPVPANRLNDLINYKWDVPSPWEAHEVEWIID